MHRFGTELADFAGMYVNLKPYGNKLLGFSPFKRQEIPSFTIDQRKKTWFCFATDQSGDVLDLICCMQRCSRKEALKILENEKYEDGCRHGEPYIANEDLISFYEEVGKRNLTLIEIDEIFLGSENTSGSWAYYDNYQ